jgi:SAM-dependent methyltransferase
VSERNAEGAEVADGAEVAGKPGFLDTAKVAEFWNQARKKAEEDQQTGYLQDEWPAALGKNRLRGEWAQVSRWLDEHAVPRGACLDVGCGSGVWLERLARRFDRVHGIDLSSEMVSSARAHLARCGIPNATVEVQGALDLPAEAQYDLIFVGGVLMYLNDDVVAEMLRKLRSMLTPAGLLILRESTSSPEPWYRDTPLSPGLFAAPGQPRAPYFAIYRKPETYLTLAAAQQLRVVESRPNRDYKLADLTESTLRLLDRLRGGALRRDRPRAERAAQWIYRLRHLLLLPRYHLTRWLAPGTWKINNRWILCRAGEAVSSGEAGARPGPAPAPGAPAARSS